MSLPPESIEVGRCNLTRNDQVVRVLNLLSDSHVVYAFRSNTVVRALGWTSATTGIGVFAHLSSARLPATGHQRWIDRAAHMSAYGARAVVIAALEKMVQEGSILGFQTLHFGKADAEEDRTVIVTVPGHLDAAAMRTLAQEITRTLRVLTGEVVVTVTHTPSGR